MNVKKLTDLIDIVAEPDDELILEINGVDHDVYSVELDEMRGCLILKGVELDYSEYDDDEGTGGGDDDEGPDLCTLPEPKPTTSEPVIREG